MKVYKNEDKECECWKCELKEDCICRDKYQRLPRTNKGALGLCPKLKRSDFMNVAEVSHIKN